MEDYDANTLLHSIFVIVLLHWSFSDASIPCLLVICVWEGKVLCFYLKRCILQTLYLISGKGKNNV